MSLSPAADVTRLLHAWRAGDEGALERLTPLVYDELRRLAHARLRGEHPGRSFQTTALVNEAYLKLVEARDVSWQDRTHFFALCAQAMRHILVDAARARHAAKRGGENARVPLVDEVAVTPPPDVDVLALNEALEQLAESDPRKAQIVELRYFGGLSIEETAEALQMSRQTVIRDWSVAKLRLIRALRHAEER